MEWWQTENSSGRLEDEGSSPAETGDNTGSGKTPGKAEQSGNKWVVSRGSCTGTEEQMRSR